jgi:hypothetical protein
VDRALAFAIGLGLANVWGCGRHPTTAPDFDVSRPPDLRIVFAAAQNGRMEGMARRAAALDELRRQSAAVLLVDAGDFLPKLGDPSITDSAELLRRARLVANAYTRMGVDAATLGERDLSLGQEELEQIAHSSGLPIVAANLNTSDGRRVFPAERLIQTAKLAVGVFGIIEPSPSSPPAWAVTTDAVSAARSAVSSLHAHGAGTIVGIFHVVGGARRAAEIAAQAGGIDAVVVDNPEASLPAATEAPLIATAGAPLVATAPATGSLGVIEVRVGRTAVHPSASILAPSASPVDQLGVALLARLAAGPVLARIPEPSSRSPADRFERWTYASTGACAFCHQQQVTQWKTTAHARAFASLTETGYARDPACLGCHMTGFLRPGGTQYVDTAIEQFADVGCESCHGASAEHVASLDKKKGTSRKVALSVCLGCHTPDQSVETFDVIAGMKAVLGPGHGEPGLGPDGSPRSP